MQRILWCLLLLVLMLSSCVPNKRIVYLQHKVEPELNSLNNTDSISRTYTTRFRDYQLKAGDVISVRIGTLTPTAFDFIQKYEEDLGLVRKLNQYDQANKAGGVNQRIGGGGGGGGGGGNAQSSALTGNNAGLSSLILDRMQTGFILDQDGYLELPKIGKVLFQGLTIPEAEKSVKEKLDGYFETPVVRIQLLSFHFTILGEVIKEGRYTVFDPNANIFDALSIAGNLTDFADRSNIKIVRTMNDKASVIYVNALRENLLEQPGFWLQPNDLIIVPPLEARAARKYTLPNYTTAVSLVISTLTLVLLIINLSK